MSRPLIAVAVQCAWGNSGENSPPFKGAEVTLKKKKVKLAQFVSVFFFQLLPLKSILFYSIALLSITFVRAKQTHVLFFLGPTWRIF